MAGTNQQRVLVSLARLKSISEPHVLLQCQFLLSIVPSSELGQSYPLVDLSVPIPVETPAGIYLVPHSQR